MHLVPVAMLSAVAGWYGADYFNNPELSQNIDDASCDLAGHLLGNGTDPAGVPLPSLLEKFGIPYPGGKVFVNLSRFGFDNATVVSQSDIEAWIQQAAQALKDRLSEGALPMGLFIFAMTILAGGGCFLLIREMRAHCVNANSLNERSRLVEQERSSYDEPNWSTPPPSDEDEEIFDESTESLH